MKKVKSLSCSVFQIQTDIFWFSECCMRHSLRRILSVR